MINTVTFNGVNFWEDLGAALSAPISYPLPAEIKESITIKGANGSLTESTGYFNTLEIEAEFKTLIGHGSDPDTHTFKGLKRKINLLFNNIINNRLMFSDVPNRYYKVSSCGLASVTKISEHEATFKVIFKCDPFLYNPSERPITSTGVIEYNGDIPNAPFIKFVTTGGGQTTVHCNDKQITFESQRNGTVEVNMNPYSIITIDGKPVKSTGTQPVLKHGRNEIRIIGITFDNVEIIKNERYLG